MSTLFPRGAAAPPRAHPTAPIRVMIVDDSAVIRGLMTAWIGAAEDIEVVATCRTGRLAVEGLEGAEPDVIVLDIEMPDMTGIEALPLILAKRPTVAVIMASTLTRRNAEISLRCLSLGATDYVPKPDSNGAMSSSTEFQREILDKIRHLGRRSAAARLTARPRPKSIQPTRVPTGFRAAAAEPAGPRASPMRPGASPGIALRSWSTTMPRVLLIGSSTGGPQALNTVIGGLGPVIDRVPVLITQHMPATFTTILAEHLGNACGRPCAEGRDGELLRPGHIYVAPGGRHMTIVKTAGGPAIALNDGPLVHFCRPAVDPLFQSGAEQFGAAVLAIVLTGMGHDGAAGAGAIVSAGGSVIAQDEATSVVWGMPGATAQGGHCAAVLPINAIAPKVARVFAGDRS